jgi:hypothetical protein
MDSFDEYRRLARECLQVGRTVVDPRQQVVLSKMASVWIRLADEHTLNATLPTRSQLYASGAPALAN